MKTTPVSRSERPTWSSSSEIVDVLVVVVSRQEDIKRLLTFRIRR